jgi:hypothetical protein
MKYFIDTEFNEHHKQVRCLNIKIGKAIPTIDLISIGIVSEDGKEYYAISKDFNIKDAWYSQPKNDYWLRENVLKPIFKELSNKEYPPRLIPVHLKSNYKFTLKNFTRLIKKYGKTNKQIANEIKELVFKNTYISYTTGKRNINGLNIPLDLQFYAYYADYDWVVFAQLYDKMINLPKGYPMYCKDLKQIYDDFNRPDIKTYPSYPKQDNEHNALDDAKWNKELYIFLNNLNNKKDIKHINK